MCFEIKCKKNQGSTEHSPASHQPKQQRYSGGSAPAPTRHSQGSAGEGVQEGVKLGDAQSPACESGCKWAERRGTEDSGEDAVRVFISPTHLSLENELK